MGEKIQFLLTKQQRVTTTWFHCSSIGRVYHLTCPLLLHPPPPCPSTYRPYITLRSRESNKSNQEKQKKKVEEDAIASEQERQQLDAKARLGDTVVPGGTGGKSLEAQEHLAKGRSRGGQTRKEQLGHEGYQELGHRGGQSGREQMGHEGYPEMGRKGGLSTMDKSGGEPAKEEGFQIDESKFRTRS